MLARGGKKRFPRTLSATRKLKLDYSFPLEEESVSGKSFGEQRSRLFAQNKRHPPVALVLLRLSFRALADAGPC